MDNTSVIEFEGEFWAYVGEKLIGIYTCASRAREALGAWAA